MKMHVSEFSFKINLNKLNFILSIKLNLILSLIYFFFLVFHTRVYIISYVLYDTELCFSTISGFYFLRYLPHCVLVKVLVKIIKKSNNLLMLLERIRTEMVLILLQNMNFNFYFLNVPVAKTLHVHYDIVLLPALRKVDKSILIL
jgi:hypothetical protein